MLQFRLQITYGTYTTEGAVRGIKQVSLLPSLQICVLSFKCFSIINIIIVAISELFLNFSSLRSLASALSMFLYFDLKDVRGTPWKVSISHHHYQYQTMAACPHSLRP